MESVNEKPQPTILGVSQTLPRLKTVPIKAGLLSTNDSTQKSVRLILALIRVLLASFWDVKARLPGCQILAKDGAILFRVTWQAYWLDFDNDGDLTIAEVVHEKGS